MTNPDSSYAKPFLSVPAQVRRLRERGMDCGTDEFATGVLQRYGYYRLSGYWHLYWARPEPPDPRFDDEGREIRLKSFVAGANLAHVVSLYEFDHELRTRLGDALSTIETAFRFFIGHRLGRADAFAHRDPEALGAMRNGDPGESCEPTSTYRKWLEEYDRHEKRARGDFIVHFREKYGPHLPIWVATEVMSFGVLSSLYDLMRQGDQEILAARFQVHAADGRGDRGAMGNWLNNLRNVRNVCAHYGRLWNRTFDVLIDVPGEVRKNGDDALAPLAVEGTNNKLYGVLLIVRYLLLSIAPERSDVVGIVNFIEARSGTLGIETAQLGFPAHWRSSPIWGQGFALDSSPMLAADLLDRVESLTAPQARAALTAAKPRPTDKQRTPEQLAAATRGAQKSLLRTYLKYRVVIEIELGKTKHYPAFQFRDGKIVQDLAEINRNLALSCGGAAPTRVAAEILDWWQTHRSDLPKDVDGNARSPLDLLGSVSQEEFAAAVRNADEATGLIVPSSTTVECPEAVGRTDSVRAPVRAPLAVDQ